MTLIILFFLQVQSNGWLILYGNPNLQFMNTNTTDADTKENKWYYTGTLNRSWCSFHDHLLFDIGLRYELRIQKAYIESASILFKDTTFRRTFCMHYRCLTATKVQMRLRYGLEFSV